MKFNHVIQHIHHTSIVASALHWEFGTHANRGIASKIHEIKGSGTIGTNALLDKSYFESCKVHELFLVVPFIAAL